jgi:hypothetical protein
MSWVKLDDGFTDHPKIAHVGAIGAWLQIQALCYCNRNLTDGFIPYGIAQSFLARGVVRTDARGVLWTLGEHSGHQGLDLTDVDWPGELVTAGLWEEVAGGYRIHDYEHYQPTKAQVLAERAKWLERQHRHREQAVSRGVSRRDSRVTHASPVPVPVPVSGSGSERSESMWLIAPASPAAQTRTGRAKPKVPWPDGFELTPARAAYATRQGLDAAYEWGKFRAHALRDDVRHVNWDRGWEYWVRNAWEIARRHG